MSMLQVQPVLMLFRNVENAAEIRQRILQSGMECAVLKPKLVLDPFQVLVATQLSAEKHHEQSMKTRSVYSEIVYSMSANKKITDSLKTFGIGDDDKDALIVTLSEEHAVGITSLVRGERRDLSEIAELSDEKEIKKVYKIKEQELKVGTLLEAVINRISTKECVTF